MLGSFGCAMCSLSPHLHPLARARAGVDAPTSPSSLAHGYIQHARARIASDVHRRRRTHARKGQQRAAKNPFTADAGRNVRRRRCGRCDRGRLCDRRGGGSSGPHVVVRRGAKRRRHGGGGDGRRCLAAGPVARVRGVPVRAPCRSGGGALWPRRAGSGAGAAGVRTRVPRGLHRQVAAAAPRVPSMPPPRAARRRTRSCRDARCGIGDGGGACLGAAGEDCVRLRRREGVVDAQPVRQSITNSSD